MSVSSFGDLVGRRVGDRVMASLCGVGRELESYDDADRPGLGSAWHTSLLGVPIVQVLKAMAVFCLLAYCSIREFRIYSTTELIAKKVYPVDILF